MSHHLDWSSLPVALIVCTAERLNAVNHVRFRSVCTAWRQHTEERRKAPLLILVDFNGRLHASEPHRIKALSLFDIIRKEIIPIRLSASFRVSNCYYLGSSHGWIFIGRVPVSPSGSNGQRLKIRLLNPFTDDFIDLPSLRNVPPIGRVFLFGQPGNLQDNNHPTVIYHLVDDDDPYTSEVNFINTDEQQWSTFLILDHPDDVVAIEDHLYFNKGGVLTEISLEIGIRLDVKLLLRGLLPVLSSDSTLCLRFLQDLRGHLHLLFTAEYQRSYCFLRVDVHEMRDLDVNYFNPPRFITRQRFLLIRDDFTVEPHGPGDGVCLRDYYPFRLLLRLSMFWATDQNRWEAVGWITPTLL
ncbi:F-box domain-containing protein [Dioscorea alata]|uniref:F-box domain-containing protein n=1 Tax=Dioscorea alata TaxID=55571 RepID=A0ACB7UEC6_DIOAL|nr:F-box domain-containing protein [Dioscorea alata]